MKDIFKFICCGSVDDGKSTLIGRILCDTGNVKKDQLEDARKASLKNGSNETELSMLLDGLLSEREQQITIDVANRFFDYNNIRFHILDCPGHSQYTKNMAIAAAEADSAIIVIDVTKGIQEQTKKHIEICSLFHIRQICICLSKCDLIFDSKNTPDKTIINKLTKQIQKLMNLYNFDYKIIPISSIRGYNIDKVLTELCSYAKKTAQKKQKLTSRILHIQAAKLYKKERYYYGREVNNFELIKDKTYTHLPSNLSVTITNIPVHGCFQIAENIDISKGDCITNAPLITSNKIKHKTIWFDSPSKEMLLKHGSRTVNVIKYSDSTIELDNNLFFNNIEDIKQNGFGIFIDVVTKKTLGCCVFTGNKHSNKNKNQDSIIFLFNSETKAKQFLKSTAYNLVMLNLSELKKTVFKKTKADFNTIYSLAVSLKEQGFYVAIIASKKDVPKDLNKYKLTIKD